MRVRHSEAVIEVDCALRGLQAASAHLLFCGAAGKVEFSMLTSVTHGTQ